MRTRSLVAVVGAAALLLPACASATAVDPVRDSSTDVPFTGCDAVECEGTIDGAAYEIQLPETWNGTLLIYSHGYRYAQPAPPNFEPVSTEPTSASDEETAAALLDRGFALAGSAYAANGWAVEEGVAAGEDLYRFFADNVGVPNRTILWGDSLGGLITQELAEANPEWVDGAAPFCGALAGVVPNMNLALDISYAVKTLIYPEMKLTGYASYEEAVQTWTDAVTAMTQAAADTAGGGTAKILLIAALVDAPDQTFTFDGSTIESKVKATVESLATGLGYATFARYDLEQRFGGNPSSNESVDYAERVSADEAALVDSVTAGAAAEYTALLQAGQRVPADQAALQEALAEGGDPQGTVTAPTITLHTAADPLVIVQNETFFADRYLDALTQGTATAGLLQLYTVAPSTYPEATGAPYGAGHCNFTSQSRLAVLDLLTNWVQNGVFPGNRAIAAAMGEESGYSPLYVPGPWPEPTALLAG
jgi:pimeloyl-ACP methyl ester carboxylesterase